MKDREKILRYFAASGDESKDMAMRLLDLADAVDRGRPFAVGPFMAPFARQIGQTVQHSSQSASESHTGNLRLTQIERPGLPLMTLISQRLTGTSYCICMQCPCTDKSKLSLAWPYCLKLEP